MTTPLTTSPARMFKAYGFPSPADLTLTVPLSLIDNQANLELDTGGFTILEDSIVLMGKTLLGTTRTYAQAQALCKAWRLNKPTRRSFIDIPTPASLR